MTKRCLYRRPIFIGNAKLSLGDNQLKVLLALILDLKEGSAEELKNSYSDKLKGVYSVFA